MASQLQLVMDANNDGVITLEEWNEFDWAHLLEGLREGLKKKQSGLVASLAGNWFIEGRSDGPFTKLLAPTAKSSLGWHGALTISPDGVISGRMVADDRHTGEVDKSASSIDENGNLTLVLPDINRTKLVFSGQIVAVFWGKLWRVEQSNPGTFAYTDNLVSGNGTWFAEAKLK